jgi:class 3 adenylate cyclase
MRAVDFLGYLNKTLEKNLPIMFIDIENFTNFFSELSRDRESSLLFIRSFYEFLHDIIDKCNGWINKFLGDGALAVFFAFDDERYFEDEKKSDTETVKSKQSANAAVAALTLTSMFPEFVKAFEEIYKTKHYNLSLTMPDEGAPRLRIGLHYGEVFITNWGPQNRQDYTVISHNVNLCSRLAGQGPHYEYNTSPNMEMPKEKIDGVLATEKAYETMNDTDFQFGQPLELLSAKGLKNVKPMVRAIYVVNENGKWSAAFHERQNEARSSLKKYLNGGKKEPNQTGK